MEWCLRSVWLYIRCSTNSSVLLNLIPYFARPHTGYTIVICSPKRKNPPKRVVLVLTECHPWSFLHFSFKSVHQRLHRMCRDVYAGFFIADIEAIADRVVGVVHNDGGEFVIRIHKWRCLQYATAGYGAYAFCIRADKFGEVTEVVIGWCVN